MSTKPGTSYHYTVLRVCRPGGVRSQVRVIAGTKAGAAEGVQEGCRRGAEGVQKGCRRGAEGVQKGCKRGAERISKNLIDFG